MKNALLDIDQRIHPQSCACQNCAPAMPGEYSFWKPSPLVLTLGMFIAGASIAINYFSFA